jgi:hypothetical protein
MFHPLPHPILSSAENVVGELFGVLGTVAGLYVVYNEEHRTLSQATCRRLHHRYHCLPSRL